MPQELNALINEIIDYQKRKIILSLGGQSLGKRPSCSKKIFKVAAQDAIRDNVAKEIFRSMVEPYTKLAFYKNEPPSKKINKFSLYLSKIRQRNIKRLIYVYYETGKGKKRVIYVGQAKGRGGRANQHKEFFRKHDISMVRLFRVRKGAKYLDAAECAGIHAYAPTGKEFPVENKKQSPKKYKRLHCKICTRIRRSSKLLQQLAKH